MCSSFENSDLLVIKSSHFGHQTSACTKDTWETHEGKGTHERHTRNTQNEIFTSCKNQTCTPYRRGDMNNTNSES